MSTSELFLIKGFKKLIDKDNLFHGYIFFGPGLKLKFARCLANFLENKKWEDNLTSLIDVLLLEPNDYSLVRQFLWQKPLRSARKTVVIKNAQQLTIQAQNAILKIAEEPPASALIILIVNDPESLIGTLASRFQTIYFNNADEIFADENAVKLAKKFLKSSAAERREFIKKVIQDEQGLENFIGGLIQELSYDKIKNWKIIKNILERWLLIKRYNVNKKLQLEAVLLLYS